MFLKGDQFARTGAEDNYKATTIEVADIYLYWQMVLRTQSYI